MIWDKAILLMKQKICPFCAQPMSIPPSSWRYYCPNSHISVLFRTDNTVIVRWSIEPYLLNCDFDNDDDILIECPPENFYTIQNNLYIDIPYFNMFDYTYDELVNKINTVKIFS